MRNPAIKIRHFSGIVFRRFLLGFLCLLLVAGIKISPYGKHLFGTNQAQACTTCGCITANHSATRAHVRAEHGTGRFHTDPLGLAYTTASVCTPGTGTRGWIAYQFCRHREEFIVFYWFKEHVMAAMMMMTEQLVSMAMNQMFIVGGFFDARMQMETQQLFQQLAAKAHKDYRPSFGMCEIGTLARSLAASQRQGEYNAYALSQHMQDRQARNWSMSSAGGKDLDIVHRWETFRDNFCHPHDNDGDLGQQPICENPAMTQPALRNRDVDYGLVVDYPLTIDVDFADNAVPPAEKQIFGLASNLYGHDVFAYFPEAFFEDENNQDEYIYVRSIIAKRSVAQNSFNAIVGMKSQGHAQTADDLRPYMEKVLEQLGITNAANVVQYLGERPSYYAQMEFLTKRLYQRPEFYTGLYDTPANIDRKKTALKALGLAQNMDLFKSKLRTEASLAVLTEMELQKEHEEVQNRLYGIRSVGRQ